VFKTALYSTIDNFVISYNLACAIQNTTLYISDEIKNKAKLYFTTPLIIHEFSCRLATGNIIREDSQRSEMWIENDYYHGESKKIRTYSNYIETREQLSNFINNSEYIKNTIQQLLSSNSHNIALIKELY
jgi:hypothetical protein